MIWLQTVFSPFSIVFPLVKICFIIQTSLIISSNLQDVRFSPTFSSHWNAPLPSFASAFCIMKF